MRSQVGACAICKRAFDGEVLKPEVDHDHATGRVRGLLCPRCNHMLAFAEDGPRLLLEGVEYLRAHSVVVRLGARANGPYAES
jgi:hypothetical protein